jgi:predicted metal-dependent hydrolase
MATSLVQVADIGEIAIVRKRGARSMRLRIEPDGGIRLTIPWWVTHKVGLAFVYSKAEWIKSQQSFSVLQLDSGMQFGDHCRLMIEHSDLTRPSSSWKNSELQIRLPHSMVIADPETQTWLKKAVLKQLRNHAEATLLSRLEFLADLHDFNYHSSSVRKLKARWGSCTSKQEITLNVYLVQLPEELIDYVLLHELVHTEHLHHGAGFWKRVEEVCPEFKAARKAIKAFQPRLYDTSKA